MKRSASKSIKGYEYQFLKTIEEVLSAQSSTTVTIEGIEDIDKKFQNGQLDELVQCKYHEGTHVTPSKLFEPVALMLEHFVQKGQALKLQYTLFVHAKSVSEDFSVESLEFLRSILESKAKKIKATLKNVRRALKDDLLNDFLKRFRYVEGESFDQLEDKLIQRLRSLLSCADADARLFHLPYSRSIVSKLAIETVKSKRTITKRELLRRLRSGRITVFDVWMAAEKGYKAYLRNIQKRLHDHDVLSRKTQRRFLYLGSSILESAEFDRHLPDFLESLVNKYFPLGKALENTEPWTVIVEASEEDIIATKRELLNLDLRFNDGFEEIGFDAHFFEAEPIKEIGRNKKVKRSSAQLRILSADSFAQHVDWIEQPHHMFVISDRILHTDYGERFFHLSEVICLDDLRVIFC